MDRWEAFILDMDGTLVDNMGVHLRAWTTFLADFGVEISPEAFLRRTSGLQNPQILRMMLGQDLSEAEVDAYAAQKEARYRDLYRPHLEPVDGGIAFLEEAWQRGAPLALATSANQPNVDFVLGGLGIEDLFDAVVSAEDVERGKPHPEMFLATAQQLGVEPDCCLVFEDSAAGIEAAHRAGMAVIALATTHDEDELRALPGVVDVVEDFTVLDVDRLLRPN
jgi:beta-phosphoglucomutase family hydrolase